MVVASTSQQAGDLLSSSSSSTFEHINWAFDTLWYTHDEIATAATNRDRADRPEWVFNEILEQLRLHVDFHEGSRTDDA